MVEDKFVQVSAGVAMADMHDGTTAPTIMPSNDCNGGEAKLLSP